MAAKTIGAGIGGIGETIFAMDQDKKKRAQLAQQQQVESDRWSKSHALDQQRNVLAAEDNDLARKRHEYEVGPAQQAKERASTLEHTRRLTEIGASNAPRLAEFADEKSQREIDQTKDAIRAMAERSSREAKPNADFAEVERAILKRFRGGKLPQSVIQAEIAAGRSRHLADVQGFSSRTQASGEQGGGAPPKREVTQDEYSRVISEYMKSPGVSREIAAQKAAQLYIVR